MVFFKNYQLPWEIAQTHGEWDLIVINPGLNFGPSLTKRKDSYSIKPMIEFGKGVYRTGVPKIFLRVVKLSCAMIYCIVVCLEYQIYSKDLKGF